MKRLLHYAVPYPLQQYLHRCNLLRAHCRRQQIQLLMFRRLQSVPSAQKLVAIETLAYHGLAYGQT